MGLAAAVDSNINLAILSTKSPSIQLFGHLGDDNLHHKLFNVQIEHGGSFSNIMVNFLQRHRGKSWFEQNIRVDQRIFEWKKKRSTIIHLRLVSSINPPTLGTEVWCVVHHKKGHKNSLPSLVQVLKFVKKISCFPLWLTNNTEKFSQTSWHISFKVGEAGGDWNK